VNGRVVLGVSGGIAAYKSVEILRLLQKHGCAVRVIMTRHATEFVHSRTFAVLSGYAVEVDQWERGAEPGVDHVELSHWADLLLVAPATANVLCKMASGVADDALTTYHLAHRRLLLLAPAMNTIMWRQPAVTSAVATLQERGAEVVEPGSGELACGDEGEGRLATPEVIVDRALRLLPRRGPLAGVRLLVTAGPTREAIDLVRVLTNRSSGLMGAALAEVAAGLGATATLIHGPMQVPLPLGIRCIRVDSAAEMGEELERCADEADAAFLAAAVADFRPTEATAGKLDRRAGDVSLPLTPVPDLAAALGARLQRPYVVIFAAEAGRLDDRARAKMRAKKADAVILNDVSSPEVGMEAPENEAWLITASGVERHLRRASKEEIAREILLGLSGEILADRASR